MYDYWKMNNDDLKKLLAKKDRRMVALLELSWSSANDIDEYAALLKNTKDILAVMRSREAQKPLF